MRSISENKAQYWDTLVTKIRQSLNPDFQAIHTKVDALDAKVGTLDTKVSTLNAKVDALDTKVDAHATENKARFDQLDETLSVILKRLN